MSEHNNVVRSFSFINIIYGYQIMQYIKLSVNMWPFVRNKVGNRVRNYARQSIFNKDMYIVNKNFRTKSLAQSYLFFPYIFGFRPYTEEASRTDSHTCLRPSLKTVSTTASKSVSGDPGLVDKVLALYAGSRGFDSHRGHMSEHFFPIQ